MRDLGSTVRARYGGALDGTLRSATVPYGYTVTIWSSGGLLIHKQGTPDIADAVLFVTGALLAFATLAAVAARRRTPSSHPRQEISILAAGLHVAAVGAALGVVAATETIPSRLAWIATAYAATVIYLGVASLQVALGEALALRRAAGDLPAAGDEQPAPASTADGSLIGRG